MSSAVDESSAVLQGCCFVLAAVTSSSCSCNNNEAVCVLILELFLRHNIESHVTGLRLDILRFVVF